MWKTNSSTRLTWMEDTGWIQAPTTLVVALLELERSVRQVWRAQDQDERPLLRQLCLLSGVLAAL
jgi:hypothetical protein